MPVSDCEVRDPRIRRTRQLLQVALRDLMSQKSFDEISVQDITDAATVNRATFYDHYADKYALLEAMVAGGFHKLLFERKVEYDGRCATAAGQLIQATCDYLTLNHAAGDCRRHNAFEPLMEAAIVTAIHRTLLRGASREGVSQTATAAMAATAASWAIYGAVKEWLNTPGRPSTEQVVPEILALVLPILHRAGESTHVGKIPA
jgi:AcrR family transcriptional regulator